MHNTPHRSGFVALLGAPNVGKSSLLNQVLGQKVSIVSPKPQTTRNRIVGIFSRPEAQIIFVDTPGLHQGKGDLHRRMADAALSTLSEVDVAVVLIDANRAPTPDAADALVAKVRGASKSVVLVLNKIDLVDKLALLPLIAAWKDAAPWSALVPVSARTGDGVEQLLSVLVAHLPEGPSWFPEDQVSDLPERFLCGEFIREQLFLQLQQELPYHAAVEVEEFEEADARGLVRILARIWVARESQKAIVIGRGGATIKAIGTAARRSIERFLDSRVHLELSVGVEPDWTRNPRLVRRLGHFGDPS